MHQNSRSETHLQISDVQDDQHRSSNVKDISPSIHVHMNQFKSPTIGAVTHEYLKLSLIASGVQTDSPHAGQGDRRSVRQRVEGYIYNHIIDMPEPLSSDYKDHQSTVCSQRDNVCLRSQVVCRRRANKQTDSKLVDSSVHKRHLPGSGLNSGESEAATPDSSTSPSSASGQSDQDQVYCMSIGYIDPMLTMPIVGRCEMVNPTQSDSNEADKSSSASASATVTEHSDICAAAVDDSADMSTSLGDHPPPEAAHVNNIRHNKCLFSW